MNGDNYLAALERQVFFADEHVQGSVRWYIRWYRERAPAKRCWFRIWGGVALVASISLPFALSFFPEADKPQVAAAGAWLIALAGGLNGFFQFNKTWQAYVETQYKLEHLLMAWDLERAALIGSTDPGAMVRLQEAAKNFVLAARAAITDETKSYFEEVKFPNLNLKGE